VLTFKCNCEHGIHLNLLVELMIPIGIVNKEVQVVQNKIQQPEFLSSQFAVNFEFWMFGQNFLVFQAYIFFSKMDAGLFEDMNDKLLLINLFPLWVTFILEFYDIMFCY
jgi:hypothetical protein